MFLINVMCFLIMVFFSVMMVWGFLKKQGSETITAKSAAKALEIFHHELIDLVMTVRRRGYGVPFRTHGACGLTVGQSASCEDRARGGRVGDAALERACVGGGRAPPASAVPLWYQ